MRLARWSPGDGALAFALGLMADLPRKNCWTIAEHAGDTSRTACNTSWPGPGRTARAVHDDLRGYVTEHLGDLGAVLMVNKTGDLKSGSWTAWMQRQYTGAAGRIENSQVVVCLTYAEPSGHAPIGLELVFGWKDEPPAGVPLPADEDAETETDRDSG